MTGAVIVDVVRTASGKGKPGGALAGVHPANLLAQTLKALVERTGIDPSVIDDVLAGCVSQTGDQAYNIARTALLAADFPEHIPATTIDRQCGSSQQALHFAAQSVISGANDVVVACGVESMSRVPLGSSVQGGDPFAPLNARYPEGMTTQGVAAELIAARWRISRTEVDEYAARSHTLATIAMKGGDFANEIVEVDVVGADGEVSKHRVDETVRPATTTEALSTLAPAFRRDSYERRFPEIAWVVTAGNSSPLTDGAAAALIMSEARARELGVRPRARIRSFTVTGSDPLLMLTGPIPATHKILARSGVPLAAIDVFEVNEAFASVPIMWRREFPVPEDALNPRGGAIALGHPLGASGIRILATMINYLESVNGRYGLMTMCEGGGMANATLIER